MSLFMPFDQQHMPAFGNNWKKFLLWGIVFTLLGLFAITATTFSTLMTVVGIGFLLFVSGIVMLVDTYSFWWKKWNGFFIHLVISLLYLVIGVTLIKYPVQASISVTLVLGIFYIIAGVFRIIFASSLRAPRWGWGWFSGVISLILGILIITSWPASGLFIIGLFVGIDLLFVGWAYIMAALSARKLA